MSGELTEEKFHPHRPEPLKEGGQFQRCDSVNAEHLDRQRIIAEHHRAAVARSPPQALLPKSRLPVVEIQPYVSVKKLELIDRRYGSARRQFVPRVDIGYS